MTGCHSGEDITVNRFLMKEEADKNDDLLTPDLDRFDLFSVKVKSDLLPDTLSRINYINGLLNDFKQLQLKSRKFYFFKDILSRSRTFEKFCTLELERLNIQLETECHDSPEKADPAIPKKNTDSKSPYVWEGSDSDMIELAVALYKAEAITRKDRKPITLKEILNMLEQMVGYKIKDASISHINDEVYWKSRSPFLESLIVAYEAYWMEQENNRANYN